MSISPGKQPLILRLGSALGGIILLTFISMISSIFITESLSGMGSAINQAGSLRMQSYQIAADIIYQTHYDKPATEPPLLTRYVDSFDDRLNNQKIIQAIPKLADDPIHQAYQEVRRSWQYQIKPLLHVYEQINNPDVYLAKQKDPHWVDLTNDSRDAIQKRYLSLVHQFVDRIDQMVKAMETAMEQQIKLLHLIESVSLFVTIGIVLVTILFIHSSILTPLQSLMNATQKIRQGDFTFKALVQGDNELSQLANTFNAMTSELSETYIRQEKEIHHKTKDLKQRNSAMELLYNTSTILSRAPTSSESYTLILNKVEQFLNINSGLICLSDQKSNRGHVLASTFPDKHCNNSCAGCYSTHTTDQKGSHLTSFPVRDRNRTFGLLILETGKKELEQWQQSTLQMISEQVGAAINIARSAIKEREHILNHERSSIARELHDSLAQSLTYLKFEVSRTQKAMQAHHVNEEIQDIVEEIRSELGNTYRQLRELLTTFRLSIETDELSETIKQAVEDFRQREQIKIFLDIRLDDCNLSPHEAIHLVYILREALNNIHKHAHASKVWIKLRGSPSQIISLTIQDDGIGIDSARHSGGHFGLAIMEERTAALRGQHQIRERPGGGTIIEVSFTPMEYESSTTEGDITSWINQT